MEEELLAVKQELLALKTAHRHGLGMARLWEYNNITPSGVATYDIVIVEARIADGGSPYPLIDIMASDYNHAILERGDVLDGGKTYQWTYYCDADVTFRVVSTSELASITARWGAE